MAKNQKKGKNAQKKKRRASTTRGKAAASLEQQTMHEEPQAELGAGVRVRSKGTTMPLSVKIMVGIMAFTMLTMMGAVSYSSLNDFDLLEWITGADVDGTQSSSTNSETALTGEQRHAVDATRKFAGFYVINKDAAAAEKDPQPPVTLAEANISVRKADTAQIIEDFHTAAEESRDEVLEAGKEKIQARKDAQTAKDEAKRNNPVTKFFDGLGQLRDDIATLFTNTWNGLTGADRAEDVPEPATDDAAAVADDGTGDAVATETVTEGDTTVVDASDLTVDASSSTKDGDHTDDATQGTTADAKSGDQEQ